MLSHLAPLLLPSPFVVMNRMTRMMMMMIMMMMMLPLWPPPSPPTNPTPSCLTTQGLDCFISLSKPDALFLFYNLIYGVSFVLVTFFWW